MKRFCFTLALLACTFVAQAQYYVKVGYCANRYKMDNYNAMIERYNVTRPWLDNKMDPMTYMHGPEVGFGVRAEATGFEIYCRSARGTVTASGVVSGSLATRYLKASDTYVGLEGFARIGLPVTAISLALEVSRFSTKTKVDDAEFTKTDSKLSVGFTPGLKIILGKGFFCPVLHVYYTMPFIKESHAGAWEVLDQSNFASEPTDNFRSRASHLGVSVSFALGDCAE